MLETILIVSRIVKVVVDRKFVCIVTKVLVYY